MSKIYNITPVAKPRMTQSDRWKKRPCVMKYWAFKDLVRLAGINLPDGYGHVIFYIPMPKSWSKKKRAEMDGKQHRSIKDRDNLIKALQDACYDEDKTIWDMRTSKVWSYDGKIEVGLISENLKLPPEEKE